MSNKPLVNLVPRRNKAKYMVVQAGFLALGRGLQSASHYEPDIVRELATWPEGYGFEMRVLPHGPSLRMRKQQAVMQFDTTHEPAQLVVELKNLETAFQMITTQAGIPQVYAAHGIGVVGDIAKSMSLIRMINVVEAYLFPEILSKNILKRVPKMTFGKHINRLRMLTIGMVLGK